MAINTNLDYATLFSSMSARSTSSSSSSNLLNNINLTDYNNIKSGTYYKVLKAYYAKDTSESSKTEDTDKSKAEATDSKSVHSKIKNDAVNLYTTTSELTTTGSKSLFQEKDITTKQDDGTTTTTKGYDTDAIYEAVKGFADNYNSLLTSAAKSDDDSILRAAASMKNLTQVYQKTLSSVGITIGEDQKLSVDEEKLKAASSATLKTVWNGKNSYAANIGGYAASIGAYANAELNAGNTYSSNGYYSSLNAGTNYSSYF